MRKNAACRTRCGRRNAKKGKSDMRLFIAVLLSEPMRQALLDTMAQMRAQGARGNFTRKENLHVTLAFLGETDAQGCVRAKRALDACAASCAPIPLQLGQAGRFGALWWAGLQNSAPLQALAQSAQNALRAEGFVLENRSFVPHITLARQVSAPTPLRLAVPSASCTAGRVSLMRSDRVNGVLRYTEIYAPSLSKAL